ncbi:hypothetical protein [Burkholderia cenocepacia]|uniref:hypothetical protein n=1 Tax=Burkholderia cenocepacia TaxID=95486 RepID=UPI0013DEFCDB|nr:hypothetical protein [Burkholderia cenocepacia]MCW3587355.1 hypothetical protein [Burkholderia cenocepacia]MCW3632559.1 hypothetical protein [Burkholderia cenocepacia]MCW5181790.1 hypothetical protein [Burkholderia cenocepacia]
MAKTPVTDQQDPQKPVTDKPFNQVVFLVHGDKGGVGKSFTTQSFVDNALAAGVPMAVIDADTRNPDVDRMFAGATVCQKINLRRDDGWMDVIDFIKAHPDKHVAISLPAGIGEDMQKEFLDFCRFLKTKVPGNPKVVMFWVINLFADSVNLLRKSLDDVGQHISKLIVVRNLVFGEEKMFFMWDESPLRAELEGKGVCMTISLPALHLRVTSKLFAALDGVMPFSKAAQYPEAFALSASEQFKLETWAAVDAKAPLDKVRAFVDL